MTHSLGSIYAVNISLIWDLGPVAQLERTYLIFPDTILVITREAEKKRYVFNVFKCNFLAMSIVSLYSVTKSFAGLVS
jgi:hypothetical protein